MAVKGGDKGILVQRMVSMAVEDEGISVYSPVVVECQALGWGSRHTVVSTLLRVSLIWNRDINSVITPINIQLQLCWLLCRKGPPLHQNL